MDSSVFEELCLKNIQQARAGLLEELADAFQRQNYSLAANLLEKVAAKGLVNPDLWYFRKFFRALPEDVVYSRLFLLAGTGMLHILEHRPNLARKCLERMRLLPFSNKADSATATHLQAALELLMPVSCQRNIGSLMRKAMRNTSSGSFPGRLASLTANRPSVFCGIYDFSRYQFRLNKIQPALDKLLQQAYGKAALAAANMLMAELLYQNSRYMEALSLATSAMNILSRTEDGADVLFAATFITMEALMVTGQGVACEAVILNAKDKFIEMGAFHLLPSVTALHMWVLLYTENRERLAYWLVHEAPDESGDYNLLDNFAYFVKIRVYLVFGQYFQAMSLSERLRPVLKERGKVMELCELDILLSINYDRQGEPQRAMECLNRCLLLGAKYGYYRLFADEGEAMHRVLCSYVRHKKPEKTPFVNKILEQTLEMALLYPTYLMPRRENLPKLTRRQITALRLAAGHHSNEQIAEKMQVSKATVTGYFRRIFASLEVSNRHQAVAAAKTLKILE